MIEDDSIYTLVTTNLNFFNDFFSKLYVLLSPLDKQLYRENIVHIAHYVTLKGEGKTHFNHTFAETLIYHTLKISLPKDRHQLRNSMEKLLKIQILSLEGKGGQSNALELMAAMNIFNWSFAKKLLQENKRLIEESLVRSQGGINYFLRRLYRILSLLNIQELNEQQSMNDVYRRLWDILTEVNTNNILEPKNANFFLTKTLKNALTVNNDTTEDLPGSTKLLSNIFGKEEMEYSRDYLNFANSLNLNRGEEHFDLQQEFDEISDSLINELDISKLLPDKNLDFEEGDSESQPSKNSDELIRINDQKVNQQFKDLDLTRINGFDRFYTLEELQCFRRVINRYQVLWSIVLTKKLNLRQLDVLKIYYDNPYLEEYLVDFGFLNQLPFHLLKIVICYPSFFSNKTMKTDTKKILLEIKKKANEILHIHGKDKKKLLQFLEKNTQKMKKQIPHPLQRENPNPAFIFNSHNPDTKKESKNLTSYEFVSQKELSSIYDSNDSVSEEKLVHGILIHTDIFSRLLKESTLKIIIERYLQNSGYQFKKNVINFPFLTDFEIVQEGKTLAINIITDENRYLGAGNTNSLDITELNFYQKRKTKRVLNIDVTFMKIGKEPFQDKFNQLIESSFE